jgi:hypothetical protein
MQYEVSFGSDIAHRPIYFEISSVSWSEELGKYFFLQVAPQEGVSSVQVIQYFFKVSVCPVFRSNLVLILFHSD